MTSASPIVTTSQVSERVRLAVDRPSYSGRVSTDIPPQDEDPVRVTTAIRWRNATATIAIPEVLVYSTGVYFAVDYQTLEVRPPTLPQTLEERRQVADEATRLMRIRYQLTDRIRVNDAQSRMIHGDSTEPGFTAWYWSAFPDRADGQPTSPAHLQLTWSDSPDVDVTVPFPPPGSPTTPADDVPEGFTDRGNNWSRNSVKLSNTRR